MSSTNGNARRQPGDVTAFTSDHKFHFTPKLAQKKAALRCVLQSMGSLATGSVRIDHLAWVCVYSLEERRQAHAAARRLWRQAACCIALALLNFGERLSK